MSEGSHLNAGTYSLCLTCADPREFQYAQENSAGALAHRKYLDEIRDAKYERYRIAAEREEARREKEREIERKNAAAVEDWGKRRKEQVSQLVTYFFLDAAAGRLKIGRSTNVKERLRTKSHEVGAELVLVATIPGDEEATLHFQFAHARLKGEWFNVMDPALSEYLLNVHGYCLQGHEPLAGTA
jgi:hypothetical protein